MHPFKEFEHADFPPVTYGAEARPDVDVSQYTIGEYPPSRDVVLGFLADAEARFEDIANSGIKGGPTYEEHRAVLRAARLRLDDGEDDPSIIFAIDDERLMEWAQNAAYHRYERNPRLGGEFDNILSSADLLVSSLRDRWVLAA